MKSILLIFLCYHIAANAQCDGFSATIESSNPICNGHSDGKVEVTLIESGTAPFSIEITNIDDIIVNPFSSPSTGNSLVEGWYFIHVIDAFGCEAIDSIELIDPIQMNIENVEIIEPSEVAICDGSINIVEVSGDFETLSYIWAPDIDGISGIGANILPDICSGNYTLHIGNEKGCAISEEFEIGFGLSVEQNKLLDAIQIKSFDSGLIIENTIKNLRIRIFDTAGKPISNSYLNLGENQIYLSNTNRVYLYQLVLGNEAIQVGKIVF